MNFNKAKLIFSVFLIIAFLPVYAAHSLDYSTYNADIMQCTEESETKAKDEAIEKAKLDGTSEIDEQWLADRSQELYRTCIANKWMSYGGTDWFAAAGYCNFGEGFEEDKLSCMMDQLDGQISEKSFAQSQSDYPARNIVISEKALKKQYIIDFPRHFQIF